MLTPDSPSTPAKTFRTSYLLLIIGVGFLLCVEAYCGYHLSMLSRQQERLKEDYSAVHNITFGIFSVDEWRDKITQVVNGKVQDFKMTREQKKELEIEVEQELHSLIRKTAAEINRPQKSFTGKLKKLAFNTVVNVDEIQAQVPSFARTIITKANSPASTRRLKNIATGKLTQLERQTYDSTGETAAVLNAKLYQRYRVADADQLNQRLDQQLRYIRAVTYRYAWVMFGCVLLAAGLWWLLRNQVHLHTPLFILSILLALVLLAVGVTVSIIQVDARIGSLNFMLLGEKLSFENQVLFFQSKSILEIIQVLISQPKPDAIVVGVLLFIFVIVLPVVILLAAGLRVLSGKRLAENKVIKYLAFESGKWNMADVMVVGILMTYIGLNGILKSQLGALNFHNSYLTTVTTNNTSLQPGYLIFAGYVIYEIILTRMLKRITAADRNAGA